MKSKSGNYLGPALVFWLLFMPCLSAENGSLILRVIPPKTGFTDLELAEKLRHILTGIEGLEMTETDNPRGSSSEIPDSIAEFSNARLINYAHGLTAHFLVWIKISNADSRIKSTTWLPLLLKSHKRKYYLEADLRIIDASRNKLIKSMHLAETRNGSRSLAYLDLDETNEPALMTSDYQQLQVYSEMQDRMAERIAAEVIQAMKK